MDSIKSPSAGFCDLQATGSIESSKGRHVCTFTIRRLYKRIKQPKQWSDARFVAVCFRSDAKWPDIASSIVYLAHRVHQTIWNFILRDVARFSRCSEEVLGKSSCHIRRTVFAAITCSRVGRLTTTIRFDVQSFGP